MQSVMNPVIGGEGGIPAGCQVDANGNIFVADMRHGLIKFDPKTRSFEQVRSRLTISHLLYPDYCSLAHFRLRVSSKHILQVCRQDSKGRPMQGCNDCAFDNSGNLWITAPAGEIAPAPYKRSFEASDELII